MAVYRVTAQVIYGVEVFVEAKTQEEAEYYAHTTLSDNNQFVEYDDDWRWDKTEMIPEDELKYYGRHIVVHNANEEEG